MHVIHGHSCIQSHAKFPPIIHMHLSVYSYFNSQGLIASETEFMLVDLYNYEFWCYICERPRKNPASCIIAYCSGSGINEIANEIVRLCGIVCGAVNRRSGIDRSLRELSFDT